MSVEQLQQARKIVDSSGSASLYRYMADQGYRYALLASKVVAGFSFSGDIAQNFLLETAKSEGVSLTTNQVPELEQSMALGWVDALCSVADTAPQGKVDADLTYVQTLAFHTRVFAGFGLGPQCWILYEPGKILSSEKMEAIWQASLNEQLTPVLGAAQSETELTNDVFKYFLEGGNQSLQRYALQWIAENLRLAGDQILSSTRSIIIQAISHDFSDLQSHAGIAPPESLDTVSHLQ